MSQGRPHLVLGVAVLLGACAAGGQPRPAAAPTAGPAGSSTAPVAAPVARVVPATAAPQGLDPSRTELHGVAIAPRAGVAHVIVSEAETYGPGRRVRAFAAVAAANGGGWTEASVPVTDGALHHAVTAVGGGRVVVTSQVAQGEDAVQLLEPTANGWRAREEVRIESFDTAGSAGDRVVVASVSAARRNEDDERDDSLELSLREGAATLARWSVPRSRGRVVLAELHAAAVALDDARVAAAVVRCPPVGPHSFEHVDVPCRLDLFRHPGPTRPATTDVFTGGDGADGVRVVLALDGDEVLVAYRESRGRDRARFVVRRLSAGAWRDAAPPLVLPTDPRDAGAVLAVDASPLRLLVITSISGPELEPANPNTWQPRARVATYGSNRWSVSEAFPASRNESLGLATASGTFADGVAWVALGSGVGITGHHVVVVGRFDRDASAWTDLGLPLGP